MDIATVKQAYEKHKALVDPYFINDGKKIHTLIDKILIKLKFDVEKSDFYSLGNEVFIDVMCRYDGTQDFNGFLYSCLLNKFKTEMTRRNRIKRQADHTAISIDTPIGDGEKSVLIDVIPSNFDIEKEAFGDNDEEEYSEKMLNYLSRLSKLQKEVLRLSAIGFTASEIKEELHITNKQYNDSCAAIHSFRNTHILL